MKEQDLKIWNNNKLLPLEDPDVYSTRRYNENVRDGLLECGGFRNTGRTIRMILQVVESYRNNPDTQHLIVARGSSYREVIRILNMFRNQMSDLKFPNLPPDEMFPIQVIEECELRDFYRDGTLVFKDNSVTDKEKP